jgi:hypothetical protein
LAFASSESEERSVEPLHHQFEYVSELEVLAFDYFLFVDFLHFIKFLRILTIICLLVSLSIKFPEVGALRQNVDEHNPDFKGNQLEKLGVHEHGDDEAEK